MLVRGSFVESGRGRRGDSFSGVLGGKAVILNLELLS